MFSNGMRTVLFTQELNPQIPSYNGHISIRTLSDINIFVGLESDSCAVLRISHSHIGAEIKDVDFQTELESGNTINTNFKWRGQIGVDIKSHLKTCILYLDKLNKNKTLDDVELVVQSFGEISLFLADSLVDLANLDFNSIFNPLICLTSFIRELSLGQAEVIKKLTDYYIGGLELSVSYRYIFYQ